ncbi:uncharacterized protein LOC126368838 [Pectinophora gossypiella]|uniref:uncharacterized protein LOC126368838 n=1 Tax=Pectinophora gossypiella TaxID=13191 RepID=UPI00214E61B6|nr:uncharacterized protein LOC126368838 [Pectinophora gossypiella]XP_049868957.1 uncharacterized protein LOC126368838 [Pectinophora gossypiella]
MTKEVDKGASSVSMEVTKEERDLIRKRASIKGRLTAFTNFLTPLNVSSLTPEAASELQLRTGKIESLYQQYDEVQSQLECIVDDVDGQIAERNEYESRYYKTLSKAQQLLTSFCSDKATQPGTHKQVKLPTIQLPKFSGSYENWLEFRDTFSSLVHSNDGFDEISKFHYLRASLEGSAAVVIQSIEFSAINYSIAWKLLCERFDNKRLLVQNHVSALFNIETITKECSVTLKRVIDQLNKNLRALESLGEPTKQWDTLLIYIVTRKLDAKTYREWEEHRGSLDKSDSITFESFIDFLRKHANLIETLESSRSKSFNSNTQTNTQNAKSNPKLKTMISVQDSSPSAIMSCPKCKGEHNLANCSQFLAMSNEARLQLLPNYKVCFNCLRAGHYANRCSRPGCKVCKRRHNTLIHVAQNKPVLNDEQVRATREPSHSSALPVAEPSANVSLTASVSMTPEYNQGEVLLSTALVKLYDADNREYIARALLDSGSTSCLMTEKLSQQLNLPVTRINKNVLGINNVASHVGKMCRVPMKSLNENFSVNLQCFVLPSITDNVPHRQVNLSGIKIPSDLCLADPNFYAPASIDLIIGADIFWDIMGSQHIKLGEGKPTLHETRLGWIVAGPTNSGLVGSPLKCNFTKVDDIENRLTRFWQLEEVCPVSPELSPEEKMCEAHFIKNTTRLNDGSFCVRIPLKENPDVLGDSCHRARHCFSSMERRLQGSFGQMYRDFMSEYETLQHMSQLPVDKVEPNNAYFIPHHGVLRESSTTTKLRVVFNASSPTSSGVSLNSIQMVGPTVQDDLLSILLRFRLYKYVLSADVEKMYRTVLVHPDDRHLQQIYWRADPSEPLKVYQLNTVTYGTASAPFLATRCLKQIGLECEDKKVSEVILHDFWVDDLLTGGDDLHETKVLRERVTAELASARMHLRKWKSNEPELVPESAQSSVDLNIGSNEPNKVLGLGWDTQCDELHFPIGNAISNVNTKRNMLSIISQIFDPLGLLAPCIISMKMLLQRLWLLKLNWDEQLPPEISVAWAEIIRQLPQLNNLRIPRFVLCDSHESVELHIFTDASERAYGACLYILSVNQDGDVSVRLLLGKSRVAPIKPTTIPRLELCGALVGARLYEKAISSLRIPIKSTTFWTDSTIVLGWLKMLPSKLQPFVRNRVADILEKTGNCVWRHVPTDQNPADFISRGVDINKIQHLDLYWFGPSFLKQHESSWPSSPVSSASLPEVRHDVSLHVTVNEHTDNSVFIDFNRFSNFLRLKRTVAYVLRFINKCRKQSVSHDYLTNDELENALHVIIRTSQRESFPEYKLLINKQTLPKKCPLLKFNVFLDENNLMRVGGRLHHSHFSFEKKHPIVIQSSHQFTKLLFNFEHRKLFHAGPQLLLATIRETYWPIGGRNLAKAVFHRCVRCSRVKGQTVAPLMGNLPQQRLVPGGYPFENVGMDYAGPISSVSRQGRGCKVVKVFIAIFVCFTTKAIHLELVGDLTSNTFLLALRRFISRRGKPINIYSDNGTSFVGAYNELSQFLKTHCNSLAEDVANDGVNFHFIPAYAPHFGGLWEAGVKSTKFHLRRVLGVCNLTYEELNSTLIQIEAILNSRPLTPPSSDPDDLTPLTPGHFIIGRPLTALPVPDLQDRAMNHLTRFQRTEQLRQQFWARWSIEYVAELQHRTKWRTNQHSLQLDSLVLIKEDHLPPLKWKLGRVVAVHPGSDGINRVADVRTTTGVVRRAFSKICPLPVSTNDVS